MNRKLNNTLSALTASGALLVTAVLFASPAAPGGPHGTNAALAAEVGADIAVVAGALESAAASIETGAESAAPRSTGTNQRRRLSTTAMPYFSFVPRG